jgi:dCTP deaminase
MINTASQLGPSSLDVRLGTDVQVTTISALSEINLEASQQELSKQKREYLRPVRIGPNDSFVLHPGEFMLATTVEYFRFPADLAGRLEGRSSLGRLGLQVHATAGFVDPGFRGTLTFELINSGSLPIRIPPGFRLGQLCFFPVRSVQVPYEGKYVGSIGVEPSRIEEDAEIVVD